MQSTHTCIISPDVTIGEIPSSIRVPKRNSKFQEISRQCMLFNTIILKGVLYTVCTKLAWWILALSRYTIPNSKNYTLTAMMKAFLSIIIKGLFVTYQTLRSLIQCFVRVQNVYVIYIPTLHIIISFQKKLTVSFLILFSAF